MIPNSVLIKAFAFLLVIHCLACCSSCCGETCRYSQLNTISLKNRDNSGQEATDPLNDTIPAAAYNLQVTFRGTNSECAGFWKKAIYDLSNPCMAVYCRAEMQTPDTIDKMVIQSTSDFNPDYPAGSDLREFFVTEGGNETQIDMWGNEMVMDYFLFLVPDSVRTHSFIVSMYLTNGRILSDTTDAIVLTL